MNFSLYLHEFPHICNIYDDNTMFYIDLWGFTNDPLYLVYNSAEQEYLVLCIFHFQRPIRIKIDLGFLEHHFFIGRNNMGPEAHVERPEGRKSIGGAPYLARSATHPLSPVDRPIALILSPADVF